MGPEKSKHASLGFVVSPFKGFTANVLNADKELMKSDTIKLNKELKWTKNIAKDNYIFEASNVLLDIKN